MNVSDRTKAILDHLNLDGYKELAELLETKTDRIKALASQAMNMKKFSSSEISILIEKYNFNKEWLKSGNGAMIVAEHIKPYNNNKDDCTYLAKTKSEYNTSYDITVDFKQLSNLQQEYYYHKIKADLVKNKMREE